MDTLIVAKASSLLASVWKALMHPSELICVTTAWSEIIPSTRKGQMPAVSTLSLIKATRVAHDNAPRQRGAADLVECTEG